MLLARRFRLDSSALHGKERALRETLLDSPGEVKGNSMNSRHLCLDPSRVVGTESLERHGRVSREREFARQDKERRRDPGDER